MAIIYGIADSERNLLDQMPKEIKTLSDVTRVKNEFETKIKNDKGGFFRVIKKWNYKRQIKKIDNARHSPVNTGSKGENMVLRELKKLDDSYHILCGVTIELPYYVNYKGERNLGSAQIDFVVICSKGVFMIEVKNWSDEFIKRENWSFDPYEQTDRAGRVLWITIQNIIKDCQVTNVLLSIKGNLPYNEDYRSVFVSSLDRINVFLQRREEYLDDDEVDILVDELQDYVTE